MNPYDHEDSLPGVVSRLCADLLVGYRNGGGSLLETPPEVVQMCEMMMKMAGENRRVDDILDAVRCFSMGYCGVDGVEQSAKMARNRLSSMSYHAGMSHVPPGIEY